MKLLLASRNPGKLREFAELLPDFALVPWPPEAPDIPEQGAFFQDNALQKVHFARAWWIAHAAEPVDAVLADDSGLCVDALWGGPGVLSARFGPGLQQDEKNRRLLAMIPESGSRTARFVCVLAYAALSGNPFCVVGTVEGALALEPRGTLGFGYDSIFIPEGQERTFGESAEATKHRLSHRGRACRALLARLNQG